MKRTREIWISASWLLLSACNDDVPCLTAGAVKQDGLCNCPAGQHVENDGDGMPACVAGDDVAGDAEDAALDGHDATVRDARVAATHDASADASNPDAPEDAGTNATNDARTETPRDAGASDAREDAGSTSKPDAATSTPDASTPPCTKNACGTCGALPVEVCDGADNDCDGTTDEGCTFYYKDCDQDGFAVNATGRVFAMSAPVSLTDCLGWTTKQPVDDTSTDCDDTRKTRYPGAPAGLPISSPGETLPPYGDPAWDLNCDGTATTSFPLLTGQLANGKPVEVQWCDPPIEMCVEQVSCINSWGFSGIPSCGANYTAKYACGGSGPAYYACD